MKKYTVVYNCGATGYGWSQEFDRLDEFESFVDEHRRKIGTAIRVWDAELKAFIFYKRCLDKPEIDMMSATLRDMRTSDRTIKRH